MTTALHKKPASDNAIAVTPAFVASKFGITVDELKQLLGNYPWPQLSYTVLEGDAEKDIVDGIEKRIEARDFRIVGDNDNDVWVRGWGEILEQVEQQGFTPDVLRPQYFDHHRIMRFDGKYIDGGDANFVYLYDQLLRRLVLAKYVKGQTKVVELGCGTGTSQLMLADLLPEAELVASDWSPPSQGIIKAISTYLKRPIKPVCFNMLTLEGWDELTIDNNSAVVTVHALEQLGAGCTALLEKLVAAKPKLCVHLEPVLELYDGANAFDDRAIRCHTTRNYLQNWLTDIRALAKVGKAEIIEERRLAFGDRYHEAYSMIVWKPL
jgi:SAM-dependent methyltransferase